MKSDFPYPLPEYALDEFCRPESGHVFSQPKRHDGDICAGNGYVMIRAHRGRWIDDEFPEASSEFLMRMARIPWARYQMIPSTAFREIAPIRGSIASRGTIGFWMDGTAKVNPSPVWRVGRPLVRLSLLQLIARLPRVEVAWTDDADSPLWFRFTGGIGAVAYDSRLTLASYSIFQPQADPLTGETMRRQTIPKPSFSLPGWPPADSADT